MSVLYNHCVARKYSLCDCILIFVHVDTVQHCVAYGIYVFVTEFESLYMYDGAGHSGSVGCSSDW